MLSLEKRERLEPDVVVERLLSLSTSLPAKHSSTIPLNSLNSIVSLADANSSNNFVISSLESRTPIADRAFPNLDLNAQPSEAEALA